MKGKAMPEDNKMPLVAIILVNWNSFRDTLECVDSIGESTYRNYKIVVVDNGSVDGSVDHLKARDGDFHLILSATNTGFTGGNNIGMEYALSIGADYIFLLNNDTLIDPPAIARLVDAAQKDPGAGVITPKIFFHPDRHLIWSAGTTYDQGMLMGKNAGYMLECDAEFDQPRYLQYAVGCALLIRRDVLEALGLLTEDYFATWEDVDFGLNVNRHGFNILYDPTSIVWHKESGSAGGTDNPQYVYYQTRSALVFQRRWSQSFLNLLQGRSYYFAYCMKRIVRFLCCGNWRGVVAMFIASVDAARDRLGRREYSILKRKKKNS